MSTRDTTAPEGYAAFLSYRSTSVSQARRVRKALLTLARRHGAHDFRVFLDTSSLLVGSLNAEITDALESSRHLVVLLAADTASSTWVDREIEHWLSHGGDPARLFLVRVDAALDLTWDEAAHTFAHPEQLPPALRGCFDVEQKWLDLSAPGSGANEASLAPLYAALAGVETSALLLEEAEYQRRRRRLVVGAVGVMAVLLVLSVVGGVIALVSRNEANRQRDAARLAATRARAESEASAGLLAVPASYADAIAHVVTAAHEADTPGVRSAMLAVAAGTGGLVAAFDSDVHGTDLTGATLDTTGTLLASWGASGPQTVRLRLHDLAARRTLLDRELDLPGVTDVKVVSPARLALCDADGVVVVDLTGRGLTDSPTVAAPGSQDCRLVQLDDGAVVGAATTASGREAAYVPLQDAPAPIHGAGTVAAGTDTALVSGPGGSWLVSPAGVRQVSTAPASGAGWGDTYRNFWVQTSPHSWAVAYPGNGWQLRPAVDTVAAVDAAPLVDVSMTGQAAWITADGQVRWTGDGSSVQLGDDPADAGEHEWATRIVPVGDGELLAIWRHGSTFLLPPGETGVGTDWTPLDNGWKYRTAPTAGFAATDGEDALFPGCDPGGQVALHDESFGDEDAATIVDSSGQSASASDVIGFGPDCSVIDAGSGLRLLTSASPSTASTIRPEYTGQHVQVSLLQVNFVYRAVLAAPGAPTEVVTVGAGDTAGPWGTSRSSGALAGQGERRVVLESTQSDRTRLVLVGPTGVSRPAGDLASLSELVAVRPDGLGAVTTANGSDRTLVDGHGSTPLAAECTGQPLAYLPGPRFETSVPAAEAQVPAGSVGGTWQDCRSSEPAAVTQQAVATYDIGAHRGLIVATGNAGTLEVVSWSRSHRRPTVVPAPPATDPARLGVTPDGRGAVTVDDRRTVRVWSRDASGWRLSHNLATTIPDPASVDLVDGASLVLVVGRSGTFELLDAATGRSLVSSHAGTRDSITDVRTTVRSGVLYAYEQKDNEVSDFQVLDVPISIAVLRTLLCQQYATAECTGA